MMKTIRSQTTESARDSEEATMVSSRSRINRDDLRLNFVLQGGTRLPAGLGSFADIKLLRAGLLPSGSTLLWNEMPQYIFVLRMETSMALDCCLRLSRQLLMTDYTVG
jgi:hypothetical protein